MGNGNIAAAQLEPAQPRTYDFVYTPIICPRCRSRTGAEIHEGKAVVYCRKCKIRIWVWIRVVDEGTVVSSRGVRAAASSRE